MHSGRVGLCAACGRTVPLTRHHLVPKKLHARMRRQSLNSTDLQRTIPLCRRCHNAVHDFYSEKKLAERYNTPEKLLNDAKLVRHFHWVSRQKR